NFQIDPQIEDFAGLADAVLVKHDVEFAFTERRGNLVLGDPHADTVADGIAALFDAFHAADVEAHAGIKFQRPPTRLRLRASIHHADFFTNLVGEQHCRVRLLDRAAELAQRLTHQASLKADMAV